MTKNKNKIIASVFLSISLITSVVGIAQSQELAFTPEAKAESTCPAPIPSTHMVVRSGSANGPILGTYFNEGWNMESGSGMGTVANLQVPSGTVLYYSSWTEGVELTNRSPGSTHSISGSATVTAPGNKAGFYPSGYYFSKQQNLSGYTTPITSNRVIHVGGHNSCWGGFDDGESWISLMVSVDGGGGNPSTITRSATNTLAIVKNPTVSLLANGAPAANVSVGGTVNLTWVTDSVNIGNSCQATNNNSDASWNGSKVGQAPFTPPQPPPPSGGDQVVGPFNSTGTFTYTIQCYGLNNVASAPASVQIVVGNGPYYTCSPNPVYVPINLGGSGSITINTSRFNGHSTAITYSDTISGPAGVSPTITYQNNGQTPPDSPATVAIVSTTPSTTAGSYTVTFSGTGGVNCTSSVTLLIEENAPDANITCEGLANECSVNQGDSATISWDSSNVDTCQITKTPPVPPASLWTGLSGTQESGPLFEDTRYIIYCEGQFGSATDLVLVKVIGPGGSLEPPQNVVATANPCTNEISVSWSPPRSGNPTGYNIYRKILGGTFAPLANNVTSPYKDNSVVRGPLYVYGITALYNLTETTPPIASNAVSIGDCTPDLDGSDKDTVSVGGFSAELNGCNGTPELPPSFTIGNSGDTVRFRICVVNSGSVDLSNVTVTELPNFNEYTRNLRDIQFVAPSGVDNGSVCNGSPSGNSWVVGNMPAQTPFFACYIYVTAKLVEPNGPSGDLYRAQNVANITANYADGSITKQVSSTLFFFSKGGGIPDRTETPPR